MGIRWGLISVVIIAMFVSGASRAADLLDADACGTAVLHRTPALKKFSADLRDLIRNTPTKKRAERFAHSVIALTPREKNDRLSAYPIVERLIKKLNLGANAVFHPVEDEGGYLSVHTSIENLLILASNVSVTNIISAIPQGQLSLGTEIAIGDSSDVNLLIHGQKWVTIRNGRRDQYRRGLGTMLFEDSEVRVPVTITELYFKKFSEVTRRDLQGEWGTGTLTLKELFEGMKSYYPDITMDSEVTVVYFEPR